MRAPARSSSARDHVTTESARPRFPGSAARRRTEMRGSPHRAVALRRRIGSVRLAVRDHVRPWLQYRTPVRIPVNTQDLCIVSLCICTGVGRCCGSTGSWTCWSSWMRTASRCPGRCPVTTVALLDWDESRVDVPWFDFAFSAPGRRGGCAGRGRSAEHRRRRMGGRDLLDGRAGLRGQAARGALRPRRRQTARCAYGRQQPLIE